MIRQKACEWEEHRSIICLPAAKIRLERTAMATVAAKSNGTVRFVLLPPSHGGLAAVLHLTAVYLIPISLDSCSNKAQPFVFRACVSVQ